VPNVVEHARRLQASRPTQAAFAFLGDVPGSGAHFPLTAISPDSLHGAVVRWLALGHALSFGLSGDGGALGVHLIASGEKRSRWFGQVSELEDFLATIPGPDGPVEGGGAPARR
jgi:hypothetical protein